MNPSARHTRVGSLNQRARHQAAGAAGEQHEEDHHRQRIRRISEEEHEALDEGDLDHDVAEADGDEVQHAKLAPERVSGDSASGSTRNNITAATETISTIPEWRCRG